MPAVYAGAILLTTGAMLVHPAPVAVLAAGAGAVLLAILVALRPPADPPRGGLARAEPGGGRGRDRARRPACC